MNFSLRRKQRSRPRIDMLPMIDVVMFLLVFFMLFTTFRTQETGIEVDLPRAQTGDQQIVDNLIVTITRSGAIYVDGRLSTLSNFQQTATTVASSNPTALVTIRGDGQSYYEHVVSVMDVARQAGLSRFAFATQPDST